MENELANLKSLVNEKELLIKELTEKNEQLENNKSLNKFKAAENNNGRISMGLEDGLSDFEKIERLKKNNNEYKETINANKEQMSALKNEIKNLSVRLQDVKTFQGKIKNFDEFKKLVKSVVTWYKPFKKEQKEALKSLEEYLDK